MHSSIKEHKNIIFLMLYYVFLTITYIYWISPTYYRAGFVVSNSISCSFIGFFAASILSVITNRLIMKPTTSNTIVIFLILLYFYPQIVLFSHCLNNWKFFLFVVLYFIIMCVYNRLIDLNSTTSVVKENENVFVAAVVFLGLLMVAISGIYTGFRISFDLSDYYEYRFAAREYSMPTIVKYLFNWAKTILPIGLTYAVISKKWWLVIFTTISEMLCFSFDGKKSSLFIFLLAFAISFLYKKEMFQKFPQYMIIVNLVVYLEQFMRGGESFVGKNIMRRMMFIPAFLGWAFYDFFSTHEFDYLRSSFLRRIGFQSPYSEGIPRIIGRIYNVTLSSLGDVNANTGLCGDAFSNFGWLSILIYPLFIIIIFKLIEKSLFGLDERLQIIICLTVAYSFLSGALFTVLVTNGVLLLIVLLIFIPRQSKENDSTLNEDNNENTSYKL